MPLEARLYPLAVLITLVAGLALAQAIRVHPVNVDARRHDPSIDAAMIGFLASVIGMLTAHALP